MNIVVQKFGGTSVADVSCMKRVALRIRDTQKRGYHVVAVVSAMGKTTDELISLAEEINPMPMDREMDVLLSTGEQISSAILAMALQHIGVKAISVTGPQAGICTDEDHTKAKITTIDPSRIHAHLDDGCAVIVAGFQGLTPSQDVATLGRGGSDTTAVALAAALHAERCQIFTDVDGIYTADPRVVSQAVKLDSITCDEMLELASLGAKVLQSRAVEFAKNYHVDLEVLSSFKERSGTLVSDEVKPMEKIMVRGVAVDDEQAKVTFRSVSDSPGAAASIFRHLTAVKINVDMIVQNISEQGHTDISFTIPRSDLQRTKETVEKFASEMGIRKIHFDEEISKVSIVGVGMRSHSGVAYRMFDALAKNNINIEMISTSEIKISVVIQETNSKLAMCVLHDAFGLDQADVAEKTS